MSILAYPLGGVGTSRERLTDDGTQNLNVLFVRWERIIRENPSFDAEKSRNGSLLHMREFLLELITESETDDGKASDIIFRIIFPE